MEVNPEGVLCLGASAYSKPGAAPQYPFRGKLADVHIWADVPALPSPALLMKPKEDRPPAADFIDHSVLDGTYIYGLQTIDIFGRVARPVSTEAINARDELKPAPPVSLYAEFRPLTGFITEVSEDRIITDISLPESVLPANLTRYDLHVQQVAADGSVYREPFMIEPPPDDAPGTFRVRSPVFPRLRPVLGDTVAIGYDVKLLVRWSWTGLQRLFTPRAHSFQIYMHTGAFNQWRGTIMAVEKVALNRFAVRTDPPLDAATAGFIGLNGLAGPFMYAIEAPPSSAWHAQLRYNAAPVQPPQVGTLLQVHIPKGSPGYVDCGETSAWVREGERVPLSESVVLEQSGPLTAELVGLEEKRRLHELGVDWVLEEAPLYALVLRDVSLPPRLRHLKPANFMPGGLVGFNETDNQKEWQASTVLWHSWEESGAVRLYFTNKSESASVPRLSKLRYYPGERYAQILSLPTPPPFTSTVGSIEYMIAVTTINDRGIEGPLSSSTNAIAVNRRRPPDPPRPVVVDISRPDYYGQSQVTVHWDSSGDGVLYQLYRATDTAVYTRDMEQRRLRSGAYAGLSAEQVFTDDPDFQDWIIAMGNRLEIADMAATWQTRLFVPKPASLRPKPGTPVNPEWDAWDVATPIWRAWAERFYPALTDIQLIEIAERGGNEMAFALVNESPISGTEYLDAINGRVRNRYLYRVRTVSNTLLVSTEWGTVGRLATSSPESPVLPASPMAQPPRAPVFTKIEAGDRQITLHWALNREPDLSGYRLYRAESREELEDLRWSGERDDPRLIATIDIEDPLIRVRGGEIALPEVIEVAQIIGVYRLDEFDGSRPSGEQMALNYATDRSAYATGVIRGLRRIADGVPVVVVVRVAPSGVRVITRRSERPPFEDKHVVALRDYFYRLRALDRFGNASTSLKSVVARAADLSPASPPEWARADWVAPAGKPPFVHLEWTVVSEGTRCIVQRRSELEATWRAVGDWIDTPDSIEDLRRFSAEDHTVNPGRSYQYRVRVVNASGNPNAEYNVVDVPRLEG